MDEPEVADQMNAHRRRFIGAAAMAFAGAHLGMVRSAAAQRAETKMPSIKPGMQTSFRPLKQVDAGVLSVSYAEAGPATGPAVILLHGWPYDIHAFVDVAPALASAGAPFSSM